jgi:Fe-S-cluster containining protein
MHPDDDTTLTEDARDVLELSADENADLCTGCTRCCETVSIEIDAPRSPWEYDQWIWVLHHRNLELYVEKPERWLLHIETRCEQLDARGRCSIYEDRPVLCREYDPRGCERRAPLSDVAAWFKTAADMEGWLQEKRPAHWARLLAHRRTRGGATHGAAALGHALVQLAEPGAHEPATRLPRAGGRRPRTSG